MTTDDDHLAATPETASARTVLRRGPFTRFLGGFSLSIIGDQVWFVALGWAASRAGDAQQASLIMTCASLPRAGLLLFGGALSDRLGALRLALTSQALRTFIMAAGAIAAAAFGATPWVLITIASVFGAVDALHLPAAASLPPQLLPAQQVPAGQGAVQSVERTVSIIGAPLGGVLVASAGFPGAAAANAALFTLTLLILWPLRTVLPHSRPAVSAEAEAPEGVLKATWSGLRYVTADPLLGRLLITVTVLNLALTAPINLGTALLAADRNWGADGFSWMTAAFAAGAVLGTVWVTSRKQRPKAPAAAGLLWVAIGSICLAMLPLVPGLAAACTTAACLGFTTGPAGVLLLSFVQVRAKAAFLGRVMALVNFSALGLAPLSFALFGQLAKTAGITGAFLWSGAALLAPTAFAYTNPRIRNAGLSS